MAYAAARLVVSFQTFDSDMSTDKDAVLLPSIMKAPNLRSGPTSSPTFTSWPPRTAASKNSRHPCAVSTKSGHQTSAVWGTGQDLVQVAQEGTRKLKRRRYCTRE